MNQIIKNKTTFNNRLAAIITEDAIKNTPAFEFTNSSLEQKLMLSKVMQNIIFFTNAYRTNDHALFINSDYKPGDVLACKINIGALTADDVCGLDLNDTELVNKLLPISYNNSMIAYVNDRVDLDQIPLTTDERIITYDGELISNVKLKNNSKRKQGCYKEIRIANHNGKGTTTLKLHILVWLVFNKVTNSLSNLGVNNAAEYIKYTNNHDCTAIINHKDSNKLNAAFNNLECVSQMDNTKHSNFVKALELITNTKNISISINDLREHFINFRCVNNALTYDDALKCWYNSTDLKHANSKILETHPLYAFNSNINTLKLYDGMFVYTVFIKLLHMNSTDACKLLTSLGFNINKINDGTY